MVREGPAVALAAAPVSVSGISFGLTRGQTRLWLQFHTEEVTCRRATLCGEQQLAVYLIPMRDRASQSDICLI